MAAWLSVLKAALPYVTQIVTAALPAFTSKPEVSMVDPVVAQQIEELQAAAIKNAESIHVLAEKLQQTIGGIENVAAMLQKQVAMLKALLFVSTTIAFVALAVAVWPFSH